LSYSSNNFKNLFLILILQFKIAIPQLQNTILEGVDAMRA